MVDRVGAVYVEALADTSRLEDQIERAGRRSGTIGGRESGNFFAQEFEEQVERGLSQMDLSLRIPVDARFLRNQLEDMDATVRARVLVDGIDLSAVVRANVLGRFEDAISASARRALGDGLRDGAGDFGDFMRGRGGRNLVILPRGGGGDEDRQRRPLAIEPPPKVDIDIDDDDLRRQFGELDLPPMDVDIDTDDLEEKFRGIHPEIDVDVDTDALEEQFRDIHVPEIELDIDFEPSNILEEIRELHPEVEVDVEVDDSRLRRVLADLRRRLMVTDLQVELDLDFAIDERGLLRDLEAIEPIDLRFDDREFQRAAREVRQFFGALPVWQRALRALSFDVKDVVRFRHQLHYTKEDLDAIFKGDRLARNMAQWELLAQRQEVVASGLKEHVEQLARIEKSRALSNEADDADRLRSRMHAISTALRDMRERLDWGDEGEFKQIVRDATAVGAALRDMDRDLETIRGRSNVFERFRLREFTNDVRGLRRELHGIGDELVDLTRVPFTEDQVDKFTRELDQRIDRDRAARESMYRRLLDRFQAMRGDDTGALNLGALFGNVNWSRVGRNAGQQFGGSFSNAARRLIRPATIMAGGFNWTRIFAPMGRGIQNAFRAGLNRAVVRGSRGIDWSRTFRGLFTLLPRLGIQAGATLAKGLAQGVGGAVSSIPKVLSGVVGALPGAIGAVGSSLASTGGLIAAAIPLLAVGLQGLAGGLVAVGASAVSAAGSLAALLPILVGMGGALVGVKLGAMRAAPALGAVVAEFQAAVKEGRPFNAQASGIVAAMKNLGPAAQDFVSAFTGMMPLLQTFQAQVEQTLFQGLGDGFRRITQEALPGILIGINSLVGAVNAISLDAFARIAEFDWQGLFTGIAPALERMGIAVNTFIQGFLTFVDAASPSAERLAGMIQRIADTFLGWVESASASGQLQAMLDGFLDSLQVVFDLVGALGGAFSTLLTAAAPAGNALLTSLTGIVNQWNAWMQSTAGQEAMTSFFQTASTALSAMKPILTGLAGAFSKMVTPKVVDNFARVAAAIGNILPVLGELLGIVAEAGVLVFFAEAISLIADVIKPFLPALHMLAETLSTVLTTAITAITPILLQLAEVLGPVFTTLVQQLVPVILQMSEAFLPLIDILGTALVEAVVALVPLLISLFDVFLNSQGLIIAVVDLFVQLFAIVAPFIPIIVELVALVLDLGLQVMTALVPALTWLIGVFATVVGWIADRVVPKFEQLRDKVTEFAERVRTKFQEFKDKVGEVADKIVEFKDRAVGAFQGVLDWLDRNWHKLVDKVRGPVREAQALLDFLPFVPNVEGEAAVNLVPQGVPPIPAAVAGAPGGALMMMPRGQTRVVNVTQNITPVQADPRAAAESVVNSLVAGARV